MNNRSKVLRCAGEMGLDFGAAMVSFQRWCGWWDFEFQAGAQSAALQLLVKRVRIMGDSDVPF